MLKEAEDSRNSSVPLIIMQYCSTVCAFIINNLTSLLMALHWLIKQSHKPRSVA